MILFGFEDCFGEVRFLARSVFEMLDGFCQKRKKELMSHKKVIFFSVSLKQSLNCQWLVLLSAFFVNLLGFVC